MILLVGAILAYPSRLKQKPLPLAIGIAFLFILNQVRTSTLYYIGIHLPGYFEIAHFVVWQSVMILAVVITWLLWVGKIANVRPA
jgi:exosortase/archaeosortase family protein